MIREAWARGASRRALTAAIGVVVKKLGRPRYIVRLRAGYLGVTNDTRRPWTAAEVDFLSEHAGEWATRTIARKLGRAHSAVIAKMERLQISRESWNSYSREMVSRLMGVSPESVARWIALGYLSTVEDRVTVHSLQKFLHVHPELYSLRRVDEQWFKTTVFHRALVYQSKEPTRVERPGDWMKVGFVQTTAGGVA